MSDQSKETRRCRVRCTAIWTVAPGYRRGGVQARLDPPSHQDVELTVDWARLALELGRQAVVNKSGFSRALNGAVSARHMRGDNKGPNE